MGTKIASKKNRCGVCGKALRDSTIIHEEKRGSKIYVFENVPVQRCGSCGEIWIEEKILKEIECLVIKGQPTRIVETPVYDFALAGMR